MTELETAIADNRAAADEFIEAARALDAAGWSRARAQGAWTAGQIVEHVALTYEYSRDIVLGTPKGGSAPRVFRPFLRRLVVDSTLKAGKFTRKGRAPAMFRPSTTPAAQPGAIDRLSKAVAEFEAAIRSGHPEARHTLTHPYFGTLRTTDYLRLQAIHSRHHRAQLA
jgi:uncharacterized damage-inducible protein DinB